MGKHAGDRGNNKGFRPTEEVWEAFLAHLATMSAIEASKFPGMPSAPAFVKKRHRDPAFAARADAVLSARKLSNSGRKRITPQQWTSFLSAVDSCCISYLCEQPGMPSQAAVYKRRRLDPEFAATLALSLRARLAIRLEAALATRFPNGRPVKTPKVPKLKKAPRPSWTPGEVFHRQLSQNELYRAVMNAIPAGTNDMARDDIAADMMVAVLEGTLALGDLKARAKEFRRKHWKLFGSAGFVSIDAPLRGHPTKTLGDLLVGDSQRYWEEAIHA